MKQFETLDFIQTFAISKAFREIFILGRNLNSMHLKEESKQTNQVIKKQNKSGCQKPFAIRP